MNRRITLVALAALLAALAALYFWSSAGSGAESAATTRQKGPTPPADPIPPAHPPQRTTTVAPAKPEEPKQPPAPPPKPPTAPKSDAALMDALRASLTARDPATTLELAERHEFMYPDSPQGPERSLYAVDALIALNRIGKARDEAERHLKRWPKSPFAGRIESRTGVHPRPGPPPGY